ncbi:UDP-N-acetylmuramoyl-tripeptide--D-alanyl-D-alanine ligase [Sinimarinibacterium sp. CAU 1509]|nr:UDP-N-acetylmuramoyl-tripeptide--D-alanyl-D-alanine ligase [Sinimarinibacterium sp. CAU 1509]
MRLSELSAMIGGECRGEDVRFERVVIDSRVVAAGDLFVALRGEHHDGHGFVERALQAGAVAALVSDWVDASIPQLRVDDTLLGLQQMAAGWRQRFSMPVVAVTGSNGKTTTKQLLASVFAARGPVLATQGNLNNHIGVPLTLLALRESHRTAVIEMGANHAGEIAQLCELARPDVGVVTHAGDAHLEGFGSRDGVAKAKGEMFTALNGGVAVINVDDVYAPLWRQMAQKASVLGFGLSDTADVQALDLHGDADATRFTLRTPSGKAAVHLPLPGRHNVMNALAAAACGVALAMDPTEIAEGLSRVEAARGRLNWHALAQGGRLLDDSYNANPTSLRAAMELLASLPGRRVLVLGAMAEVGADAVQRHYEAGQQARALGIDQLYAHGELARHAVQGFGDAGIYFESIDALIATLRTQLGSDTVVLVKGSRAAQMERVVAALTEQVYGDTH